MLEFMSPTWPESKALHLIILGDTSQLIDEGYALILSIAGYLKKMMLVPSRLSTLWATLWAMALLIVRLIQTPSPLSLPGNLSSQTSCTAVSSKPAVAPTSTERMVRWHSITHYGGVPCVGGVKDV